MKTLNIKELSEDSTVENIKYRNEVATCIYKDNEIEKRI